MRRYLLISCKPLILGLLVLFQTLCCGAASSSSAPTSGVAEAISDFERRCSAPGVVRCFGFDDPKVTDSHVRPPWGERTKRGVVDTEIKASGTGSLRFEIPPRTGADTSG